MADALIEFHVPPGGGGGTEELPRPYPAAQVMPEWYKQMPPIVPGGEVGTVKRCAPFLEAMTFGYIIPVPVDMRVTHQRSANGQDELDVQMRGSTPPMLDMHPQRQVAGSPFGDRPVVKFLNPWVIKTPPGYSTLFLPPMNRFAAPIVPLCGVVETDQFYHEVHFPSVWLAPRGVAVVLAKGTPLVQVIPFRREPWQHAFSARDEEARQRTIDAIKSNPHVYREESWEKKKYG